MRRGGGGRISLPNRERFITTARAEPAPELTFREAAHFAAVGLGAVEKAVETRVLPAVRPRRGTSGSAAVRRLPLASVTYLAAVREGGLTDLALKHKRAIWGGLVRALSPDQAARALPPVEFAPATSIDVGRLAGDAVERAARYARARDAHIVSDPEIKGGTPVVRGTRMTVYSVRGRVDGGETLDDVAEDNPDLPREALEAAVIYARTHPLRGRPSGRPWRRDAEGATTPGA